MSVRESADANKVTNNSTKNINEKKMYISTVLLQWADRLVM